MRLGIDVGTVRVGIACSDVSGRIAIPLLTIKRDRRGADFRQIVELARERNVIEIVVGLPRHMSGEEGQSAQEARRFAERLQRKLPKIRVCLVDERLSSNQAHGLLSQAGQDSRARRQIVDQVAAQIILDQALEMERLSGKPPGVDVSVTDYGKRNIGE